MPKKLTSYLIELSNDPAQLQEFYDDRQKALRGSGLKQEHRKALEDDDLAAITEFVRQETGDISAWRMAPINRPFP